MNSFGLKEMNAILLREGLPLLPREPSLVPCSQIADVEDTSEKDQAWIATLIQNLKNQQLPPPICVAEIGWLSNAYIYQVVDGHHRLAAHKAAGLTHVRAFCVPRICLEVLYEHNGTEESDIAAALSAT